MSRRDQVLPSFGSAGPRAPGPPVPPPESLESSAPIAPPEIGAYYLNAHMYTCVPAHVRSDMSWMAENGTHYVCVSVLEQDLWAARENLALIIREAERAGLRVLAVPARWAGLTAGAPKVPSLFTVLHPHTWVRDKDDRTGVSPFTSGVIASIHWPETLRFFQDTLAELYRQHPSLAGLILDEPKAFVVDHSPKAREALGPDATRGDHLAAAARFYDEVCAHAKRLHPDKLTLVFTGAHFPDDEIGLCAALRHTDYFGADGRPWDVETDARWAGAGETQESGKGKVLLSGVGARFIKLARRHGKKSLLLIENHNLAADMIEPLDRHLGEVMALGADLYLYYYYPRNLAEPDRTMEIVARHLQTVAGRGRGLPPRLNGTD